MSKAKGRVRDEEKDAIIRSQMAKLFPASAAAEAVIDELRAALLAAGDIGPTATANPTTRSATEWSDVGIEFLSDHRVCITVDAAGGVVSACSVGADDSAADFASASSIDFPTSGAGSAIAGTELLSTIAFQLELGCL